MILLAMIAVIPQPTATAVDQIYSDLARKLSHVAFRTGVDRQGHLKSCTVTSTSGDSDVDRIFCDSLRKCLPAGARQTAETQASLTVCTDRTQKEMLRTLANNRATEK